MSDEKHPALWEDDLDGGCDYSFEEEGDGAAIVVSLASAFGLFVGLIWLLVYLMM